MSTGLATPVSGTWWDVPWPVQGYMLRQCPVHGGMYYTVPCRSMVHVREYGIRVSSTWWDVPYSPFPFQSGIRQSASSWYSIMSLVHVQEPPNPISTILLGILDIHVFVQCTKHVGPPRGSCLPTCCAMYMYIYVCGL